MWFFFKNQNKVVFSFSLQSKTLGQVLFDEVCQHLGLLETDYFGLEYGDSVGNKVSSAPAVSAGCRGNDVGTENGSPAGTEAPGTFVDGFYGLFPDFDFDLWHVLPFHFCSTGSTWRRRSDASWPSRRPPRSRSAWILGWNSTRPIRCSWRKALGQCGWPSLLFWTLSGRIKDLADVCRVLSCAVLEFDTSTKPHTNQMATNLPTHH